MTLYNTPAGSDRTRGGRDRRRAVGNANVTIRPIDRIVALTATLTANRTWTMPLAARVEAGQQVTIIDEVGGIDADTFHIIVSRSGSDTIQDLTSVNIARRFGKAVFTSDGVSRWTCDYQEIGYILATDIRQYTDNQALGYSAGAGSTVTQSTSKSTSVTLDKPTGRITTDNESIPGNSTVSFTFNNSKIGQNDTILLTHRSGGAVGVYRLDTYDISAGSVEIMITNRDASAQAHEIIINFVVISGATS